jgi:putative nucleotidyltransferase with HDIG domain
VDLLARDFTVNALALLLERTGQSQLIDFCRGQEDLARRQLRRVTASSLADDPVRLLRVVRFAHQLRFSVESETLTQVQRMSTTVRLASPERIRDELWKILVAATPAQALADLQSYNLLAHVLPEIALLTQIEQSPPHDLNVYEHTLRTVQHAAHLRHWLKNSVQPVGGAAEPDWVAILAPWRAQLRRHFAQPLAAGRNRLDWLVWHALLHDIGKAATRTTETQADGTARHRFLEHERVGAEMAAVRLRHLRFSRQEISLVQAVVEGHMRPHLLHAAFAGQTISRRASYRYFRDVGGRQFSQLAGLDTLLVALADYRATTTTVQDDWPAYLSHMGELFTFALADQTLEIARHKPLLDGHQLMAHFHLTPGRQVGEILERVVEAQVAGDIQTIEEALQLAGEWLEQTPEVSLAT